MKDPVPSGAESITDSKNFSHFKQIMSESVCKIVISVTINTLSENC